MYRRFMAILILVLFASINCNKTADAFGLGYTYQLKWSIERIRFDAPVLAPLAHVRFCLDYPEDCKVHHVIFHGGRLPLTKKRWAELVAINAEVNRAIVPEENLAGLAGERWVISPEEGDCGDYAVTKRHELLMLGWPERALLLSEVVTPWGEHHLVVVVRTREGDFVIDNLNPNIRPWFQTPYQWVRIQSPTNPNYWSTLAEESA
jgi:predicted transglutaminase-like cysteine proteinase